MNLRNFLLIMASGCFLAACNPASSTSPRENAGLEAPLGGSPVEAEPPEIQPGTGSIFYVAVTGSDDNDGTADAPWQTIQFAVDNVDHGDTILLQSGTYAGARIEQSGTADGWITLAAAPGASVLVNTPGPNNKHESNLEFETWEGNEFVAYWIVDGLEVAGAPNWGIDFRGNGDHHSHNFIIRNNRIHDNGLESETTGIFTAFVDDVLVEGNESFNNGEHGIYLSNSGDRFVVRGNLLHHNNNCGLHINGDLESGEDGIISNGLVENNRIYANGRGGCSGINMDGVTDTIVRNNLLYENHAGGISIFQENGAVCSQNIQVLNNTIVQAEDGRWAINISDDKCINNKILNNIILTFHEWRGSIVIPSPGIRGFESDYNVIMDRFSADDDNSVISLSAWQALGYDTNSVIATPGETFASPDDYHLHRQSPALDAGITLPGVETDIEGTARPQGSGYDMGAFEYAGAPSEDSDTSFAPVTLAGGEAGGSITYTFNDTVYRLAAQEGATPVDISQALDQLSPGGGDGLLNISPDGEWLVLESERFDPACADWACLAVITADLSAGDIVRANSQVVHPEGFSAIASGGDLVVYSAGEGPNEIDLWAVSRSGAAWGAPVLITADSPHAFNNQPALSHDGGKVVFNCGPEPYGGEGTAICEVKTSGSGFREVLTPTDSPAGFPAAGALHHPDYTPDGGIIFEGDWGVEQIWRLPPGGAGPERVAEKFGNDNSPCALPDGRIVSLWLNRPEGAGVHELKVMTADGQNFAILLPDVDVLDAGIGCAP